MKKLIGIKTVIIGGILLSLLCLLAGTAGCGLSGRFQLVEIDSKPYVIDTTTGKVWKPNSGMIGLPLVGLK